MASPVAQRTTQAKISGFSASTNTYGNGATFDYDVEIDGLVNTHCSYSDETSGPKLPDVAQTPCDDPAIRWQFRQDPSQPGGEGRYRIVVIHTPTGTAGFHEWAPADFPLNADETIYQGASDFTIDIA
ncbi:hypothetical protein GQX73_g9673 [Xylaria multiplex]|uniref:Uncharacterized protein n=1 Tax=Xylaria multiplex TaxID=323545 RepID=A0A7C8MRQ4_9PEZI|nr:hypothetical protein GQX73_g9673 [Xylaria multiplex]